MNSSIIKNSVLCIVSDEANNKYGETGGFYRYIKKEQTSIIGTSTMSELHCLNHKGNSIQDTVDLRDLLEKLPDTICTMQIRPVPRLTSGS